jgi:hypothetical protein
MNIFYLDTNPRLAAQFHCDKHCNKMILESAQLLSTAHRELGSTRADRVYKSAHKNHPSTLWARESRENYNWLWELFYQLSAEFRYRRNKDHGSYTKLADLLRLPPENLEYTGFTQPPQCMPDEYKVEGDSVQAYRNYYLGDKADIATWNWGRPAPYWWEDQLEYQKVKL